MTPRHVPFSARVLGHARLAGPLAVIYLCLTHNLQPANLVAAVLIAAVAAAIVRPPPWLIRPAQLPAALLAAAKYVVLLLIDIARSGWNVTLRVLRPTPRVSPGIIAVPAGTHAEVVVAFSAHGITVTPGEMVVAIDPKGTMYTHCLDAPASAAGADEAQRLRRQRLEAFIHPGTPHPPP
ncbi:MAG: Na+/H+ antiporter subunit E [Tepidisphaerales bacterium]